MMGVHMSSQRLARRLVAVALLGVAGWSGLGCGDESKDVVGVPPPANTGSLKVNIGGLPVGEEGKVQITGPSSYRTTVTSTTVVSGLEPGAYTVFGLYVLAGGASFVPSPTTRVVTVVSDSLSTVAVYYVTASASLTITVIGLPPGSTPLLHLVGSDGLDRQIAGSTTLIGIATGQYTLIADPLVIDNATYAGTSAIPIELLPGSWPIVNVGYTRLNF